MLILEVGAKVLIPTKGSGDMMFNATFKNISVISWLFQQKNIQYKILFTCKQPYLREIKPIRSIVEVVIKIWYIITIDHLTFTLHQA